ncbi:hypothetical protein GCM10027073_08210 [Streptomyces chlorus]|uniref:Serine/arginine repetitive matrix protein 2 n=1 Tax=Streptomyces chlorus TaxID=887452 RepID=A0ABW1DU73_9ACTN
MSGAPRYWNEETQRWEETGLGEQGEAGGAAATAPTVTPPPTPPPPPEVSSAAAPTLTGIQWPGGGTSPSSGQPGPAPWSSPELSHGPAGPPAPPVPPIPAPARHGLDRRRVWAVVGGAAVVGVVVGLVLTQTLGGGKGADGQGDDKPASASVSQPTGSGTPGTEEAPAPRQPTSAAEETTSPTPDPDSTVPAGYDRYADSEGFTIARPTGWTRSSVSSQYGMNVVTYRSPDSGMRLQVFEVAEPSPDASYELFLSDALPKAPGFEQLSLETLDDGDFTGSRLEYLADSFRGEPDIGTWHVVDLRFQAADGKLYALAAYGADSDGHEDERELIRTAFEHFCPPDTTCGTAMDLD